MRRERLGNVADEVKKLAADNRITKRMFADFQVEYRELIKDIHSIERRQSVFDNAE